MQTYIRQRAHVMLSVFFWQKYSDFQPLKSENTLISRILLVINHDMRIKERKTCVWQRNVHLAFFEREKRVGCINFELFLRRAPAAAPAILVR